MPHRPESWSEALVLYYGVGSFLMGMVVVRLVIEYYRRMVPVHRVRRRGARTDGLVNRVGIERAKTETVGYRHRPVVSFRDSHGIKVTFTEKFTKRGSVEAGDRVTVYYNESDPQHTATITTDGDMRRHIGGCFLITAVIGGMAVCGFLLAIGVIPRT